MVSTFTALLSALREDDILRVIYGDSFSPDTVNLEIENIRGNRFVVSAKAGGIFRLEPKSVNGNVLKMKINGGGDKTVNDVIAIQHYRGEGEPKNVFIIDKDKYDEYESNILYGKDKEEQEKKLKEKYTEIKETLSSYKDTDSFIIKTGKIVNDKEEDVTTLEMYVLKRIKNGLLLQIRDVEGYDDTSYNGYINYDNNGITNKITFDDIGFISRGSSPEIYIGVIPYKGETADSGYHIRNIIDIEDKGSRVDDIKYTVKDLMGNKTIRNMFVKQPSILDTLLGYDKPVGITQLKSLLRGDYSFNNVEKGKKVEFRYIGKDISDKKVKLFDNKKYVGIYGDDDMIVYPPDKTTSDKIELRIAKEIDDNKYEVSIKYIKNYKNNPEDERLASAKIIVIK